MTSVNFVRERFDNGLKGLISCRMIDFLNKGLNQDRRGLN